MPASSAPGHDLKPKRKRGADGSYVEDDTPRAFARLMERQTNKRPMSGLDNGDRPAKKAKTGAAGKPVAPTKASADKKLKDVAEQLQIPKIMPGERMGDFAARVDQAMPVIGLARKGKVNIEGLKERRTKTEKRLHKMYAQWREEDVKIKEAAEEAREKAEAEEEEKAAAYGEESIQIPSEARARKKAIGEVDDGKDDPWAVLKDKREKPKGLHDVVQAPPELVKPKEKFKTKRGAKVDVANIPNAVGSLKKREELSEARKEVIERYRAMMKGNKT